MLDRRHFAHVVVRAGTVLVALWWCLFTMLFLRHVLFVLTSHNLDYAVFWTAGRVALQTPARIYDAAYVTGLQDWVGHTGPRPFGHPPSALLVFAPLAMLPFWWSYALWVTVSVLLFVAVSARTFGWRATALALVCPTVVQAAYMGQVTLALGAAAIGGLRLASSRPLAGGLILGAAAAIKPHIFLLAPVLLWSDRRALAGFFLAGLTLVLASAVFGPARWIEWLESLPKFVTSVEASGIAGRGVSPLATMTWLGITGPSVTIAEIAGAVAGLALAMWARRGSLSTRLFGMVAGAVLCSPHMMFYDLAPLAPAVAAGLLEAAIPWLIVAVPLSFLVPAITFPTAVAGFALADPQRRTDDRSQSG